MARKLAPADLACLHMVNKEIHSAILRFLDVRGGLMASPGGSSDEDRIEIERERRSLMWRLLADRSWEGLEYCEFCMKIKPFDDEWVQRRVSVGSAEQRIMDVCSVCKALPEYENVRWYTPVGGGLWSEKGGRYLGGR